MCRFVFKYTMLHTPRDLEMDQVSIGSWNHLHYKVPGDAFDGKDLAGLRSKLASVVLDCSASLVLTSCAPRGKSFPCSGFC